MLLQICAVNIHDDKRPLMRSVKSIKPQTSPLQAPVNPSDPLSSNACLFWRLLFVVHAFLMPLYFFFVNKHFLRVISFDILCAMLDTYYLFTISAFIYC